MDRKAAALLIGVCALAAGVLACSSKTPATPTAPPSTSNAAPDGSTLKANAPLPQSPVNDQKLQSTVVILTTGASTMQYSASVPLQYRFQVFNSSNTMVQDSGLVSAQTWTVTAQLVGSQRHTWRVRPEYQGQPGPWSSAASFVSADPALINDPLTDGKTAGTQLGGHFIPGVGWMTDSVTSSIYWDIPTCDNCTMEFDITNIGKGEGVCCLADLKFVSMGDANAFSSFGLFRDHPWKMHLNQRGDGDGTGLEIIWRNGAADPVGNPGDHRIKMNGGGPDFRDSSVFHFVLYWSPSEYRISVGTNGGPQVEYMQDGFGGIAYNPPNHRVALGCYPRSEGFPAAIYRNVKVTKNN